MNGDRAHAHHLVVDRAVAAPRKAPFGTLFAFSAWAIAARLEQRKLAVEGSFQALFCRIFD
jgi:hypothetical protein